jgi:hypothetical protein
MKLRENRGVDWELNWLLSTSVAVKNTTVLMTSTNQIGCRRRWLSGTILASLVLDSTGFWVRGHLFFGISPRGEISQGGFAQGLVSHPATSRYIGSVRIISEAPLVCPNGC